MKKLILNLLVTSVSLAAFAQGKITMVNDSNHLLYFISVKAGDAGLANQPIPSGTLPSGTILMVDLYGGTSAGTMTLQTTTPISVTPGFFGPVNFTSPNLPGGVAATFQIQVRESTFATAFLSQMGGGYAGYSPVFTMTPSSNIAFNSIVNSGGTSLSTWAAGNIFVPIIPEPSALALTGLGISALLLRRNRNPEV